MDNLSSLATFVSAAEFRSFTAAGRKLGISASAVGKAIARLEERLGVRLFQRSTRSITLTPEGETFLKRCRRIFAEVEAAELELAQSAGAPRGRLRVSLPVVGTLFAPAFAGFSRAYPEIELELDFSDRLVDVIEEGFDAVLRTGDAVDSQLMSRRIGSYRYVIVGSPDYLAEHGWPQRPEDLLDHACLRHRWSTTGKLESWRLRGDGGYLDLEPPASVVTNTIGPLITLAERGAGLAGVPDFTVRRQLAEGSLASVLDRHLKDAGTFRLFWPSSRNLAPRLRVFVDFMAEHLSRDLGHD